MIIHMEKFSAFLQPSSKRLTNKLNLPFIVPYIFISIIFHHPLKSSENWTPRSWSIYIRFTFLPPKNAEIWIKSFILLLISFHSLRFVSHFFSYYIIFLLSHSPNIFSISCLASRDDFYVHRKQQSREWTVKIFVHFFSPLTLYHLSCIDNINPRCAVCSEYPFIFFVWKTRQKVSPLLYISSSSTSFSIRKLKGLTFSHIIYSSLWWNCNTVDKKSLTILWIENAEIIMSSLGLDVCFDYCS